MPRFSLRQLHSQDSQPLARLMDESPDTGRVGTAIHFGGVVAQSTDYGLVGGCLIRFGHLQFEGRLRPCALLNKLVVHQGIASAWRLSPFTATTWASKRSCHK